MENKTIDSTSIECYLTVDLVWDILVHLSTKSLMRFKFVSKLWYSIIRNIDFAKNHSLYGGCFRGIIITEFVPDYPFLYKPRSGLNRVFYTNLNANNVNDEDNKFKYYKHCAWDLRDFKRVTSIVKGLIGLYNNDYFTLCNMSTGEMVKLPSNNSMSDYYRYSYHLGFDPFKDVYKVLRLFKDDENCTSFNAQIFTLGGDSDLTWRNVEAAPDDCDTLSLYINGTLYWTISEDSDSLVAFHLNSESFETIPLPPIPLYFNHLANIGGSPAIMCFQSSDIDIWMMKKDAKGRFEEWTMQEYRLPVDELIWGGTLPTGEMLITQSVLKNHPRLIFKYDHIKNAMKLILLDGDANLASLQTCYHEENIIPLAPLLIKQRQSPEVTHASIELR